MKLAPAQGKRLGGNVRPVLSNGMVPYHIECREEVVLIAITGS